MDNYKRGIAELLAEHVQGIGIDEIEGMIEVPADEKMGDYAFPCFRLAKEYRKAPQLIAEELAGEISGSGMFSKVENVNAYVNMFLSREQFAAGVVKEVAGAGDRYGSSDIGNGKTVIVEFSSPNIAKPFHIGHKRSTIIGNSLYKIYDFLGYDVVRINHLGDYGTQFGKMITAYRHWGDDEKIKADPIKELFALYVKFNEEAEKDPSLDEEARATFVKLEAGEKAEKDIWQWFRDVSIKEFKKIYGVLGIEFDSYKGESFYSDKMDAVVDELREKGLLKESNGAQIVDLEPYGLTPAIILKSDGSSLYVTRDIAAAMYRKKTYDFDKCIYVVASEQNLHFQQWFKIIELMGYDWAKDLVHVAFGMVSMRENGEIKKLSTRKGQVIFLDDLLREAVEKTKKIIEEKNVVTENVDETARKVGIGAVIFDELSNNRIKDSVFDWDHVLNFDGETGPYVQYTYARATSVLRNASEEDRAALRGGDIDASYIAGDAAYALEKLMYEMPDVVLEAAEKYEPSMVTRHVVDIAQAFNKFYHDEHILVDNAEERRAKLALVSAARTAVGNCLGLLGMEAPERM
ncbi:MAG: arginine--tRNA ligase [Anaerovoracaceae bacterium]|jgi:arginyl-tRNA synthetase